MKKSILLLITLVCLNLAVSMAAKTNQQDNDDPYKDCHSGGYGALKCSIDKGTKLFDGTIAEGCHAECPEGTYACCGRTCKCVLPQN